MNFKDILKVMAVGALVYGAYKYGETQGEKRSRSPLPPTPPSSDDIEEAELVDEGMTEKDYIIQILDSLKTKPNKTRKDRDTMELLQIKLQQILNGKK